MKNRKYLGVMNLVVRAPWKSKDPLFQRGRMETVLVVIPRNIGVVMIGKITETGMRVPGLMIAKRAGTVMVKNRDVMLTNRTAGAGPHHPLHQHRHLLRCWILPTARILADLVTLLLLRPWSWHRPSLGPLA
jgi:hypothetical protein